jgi:hypothetical protein
MAAAIALQPRPLRAPVRIWKEKGETKPTFEWTRANTLALAKPTCLRCHGVGLLVGRRGHRYPCGCVLRAIFRACYSRYRYILTYQDRVSGSFPTIMKHGKESRRTWSRKNEEFVADFYLVAKRTLDSVHWNVFRYHFLLGGDWKLCTRILHMDCGNFFHSVYRIEQRLGRVFTELQPYALFPVDEYFHGTRKAA